VAVAAAGRAYHGEVSDLLPLGAPGQRELEASQLRRLDPSEAHDVRGQLGRYQLHRRIPAGPDEECFVGVFKGSQLNQFVFLRRFARARLDQTLIDAYKRRAMITHDGIEQILELQWPDSACYAVSELVQGLGLDHLDASLRLHRDRVPWTAALAMLHDACDRITHLRGAGILHGDTTPARLRLSLSGRLYLCHGLPATADSTWARVLCDVVHPILGLAAAGDEHSLLDRLLRDADAEDALAVASDALVQHHPELDPALPLLLRSMLEGTPAFADVTGVLLESRPRPAIRRLWQLVAEALAAPRPALSEPNAG